LFRQPFVASPPTIVDTAAAASAAKASSTALAQHSIDETGRAIVTIGKITLFPQSLLGMGSHGTLVYDGLLDGKRPIAVKRLLVAFVEAAKQEIALLIASDLHANVLRYYAFEQDGDFVYVALERCHSSLGALIDGHCEEAVVPDRYHDHVWADVVSPPHASTPSVSASSPVSAADAPVATATSSSSATASVWNVPSGHWRRSVSAATVDPSAYVLYALPNRRGSTAVLDSASEDEGESKAAPAPTTVEIKPPLGFAKPSFAAMAAASKAGAKGTKANTSTTSIELPVVVPRLERAVSVNKRAWPRVRRMVRPSPALHRLLYETVSGVAHLHSLNIVHRDLKPQYARHFAHVDCM
jgi:hypothetical protein